MHVSELALALALGTANWQLATCNLRLGTWEFGTYFVFCVFLCLCVVVWNGVCVRVCACVMCLCVKCEVQSAKKLKLCFVIVIVIAIINNLHNNVSISFGYTSAHAHWE